MFIPLSDIESHDYYFHNNVRVDVSVCMYICTWYRSDLKAMDIFIIIVIILNRIFIISLYL